MDTSHFKDQIVLPRSVLTMGIDPYEITVFAFLSTVPTGQHISTRNIATVLGLSRKRVEKSLSILREKELVTVERQIWGINRYRNVWTIVDAIRQSDDGDGSNESGAFVTAWT